MGEKNNFKILFHAQLLKILNIKKNKLAKNEQTDLER